MWRGILLSWKLQTNGLKTFCLISTNFLRSIALELVIICVWRFSYT